MSVVKMELPSPFPRVEQKASLNPERIRCARETAIGRISRCDFADGYQL